MTKILRSCGAFHLLWKLNVGAVTDIPEKLAWKTKGFAHRPVQLFLVFSNTPAISFRSFSFSEEGCQIQANRKNNHSVRN